MNEKEKEEVRNKSGQYVSPARFRNGHEKNKLPTEEYLELLKLLLRPTKG